MARGCTVCQHARREEIDVALTKESPSRVAKQFHLDRMTVKRHAVHMRPFKKAITPVITPSEQLREHREQDSDHRSDHSEHREQDSDHRSDHSEHGEQDHEWSARFDHLDALMEDILVHLQTTKILGPEEPSAPRVPDMVMDEDGIEPRELVRRCVQGIQVAWRQTPRQGRSALMRQIQEGLQGIASDEEVWA